MEIFVPSSSHKDKSGQRVHWEKPYFDQGLRKTFNTALDKAKYMNENNIVDNGDSQAKAKKQMKQHIEQKNDERR